jgi:hypothetical protein
MHYLNPTLSFLGDPGYAGLPVYATYEQATELFVQGE